MRTSRVTHFAPFALTATLALLHAGCTVAAAPAPNARQQAGVPPEVSNPLELDTIEVNSSAGLLRKTSPGRPVQIPIGQGIIQVVVRRLFPDPGAVRVHAQPADGEPADEAPWQVDLENSPVPDALAFRLHGGQPGRVAVSMEAPGRLPVGFIVDVTRVPLVHVNDHGQVLRLGMGERFVLDADLGYVHEARVLIEDPGVLRLLRESDDGRPPKDAITRPVQLQNEYEAVQTGRTTIRAFGDSGCGRVVPSCKRPDLNFRLGIDVR